MSSYNNLQKVYLTPEFISHLLSSNSSYFSNVESSPTIHSQPGQDKENDDGNSGEDIMKSNPEPSDENDESYEKGTLNNNSSKAAETLDGNEQENDFEIVGNTPSENTIHHYVEVQSDHQDDATGGYEIATGPSK